MRELWQIQLADRIQAVIESEAKRLAEKEVQLAAAPVVSDKVKAGVQGWLESEWYHRRVKEIVEKHAHEVVTARLDGDIEERLDKVEETIVEHLTENIKERIGELIGDKVDELDLSDQAENAVEEVLDKLDLDDRIHSLIGDNTGEIEFDKRAREALSDVMEEDINSGRLKEVLDTVDLAAAEVEKIQAGLGVKIDEYLAQGVEWDTLLGKLLHTAPVRRAFQTLIAEEVDNALLEQVSYRPAKKRSWWRRLLLWLAGEE